MKKVIKKTNSLYAKLSILVRIVDSVAISVAKGFNKIDSRLEKVETRLEKVETRLDKVEIRIGEMDLNIQSTRRDVLNMGDKFVSYHMFDQLASRVYVLEKKQK